MLFTHIEEKTPEINFNENEICELDWVSQTELETFISTKEREGETIAPWFLFMVNTSLHDWWSELREVKRPKNMSTANKETKIITQES